MNLTPAFKSWLLQSDPKRPDPGGLEKDAREKLVDRLEKTEFATLCAECQESLRALGGPGSGNYGHSGRPGEVGGSGEGGAKSTPESRERAKKEFEKLKGEWARVNDELFQHFDRPDSPAAQAKLSVLKGIVKEMHRLDADPGGLEGIGLPGGPRDLVIIGGGPGGLSSAVMGGADGLDTLLIEGEDRLGGQSKFSSRVENYPGFPMGVSGDRLAKNMSDQVERLGPEVKLGTRVTGLTYDSATGMKTLTLSNGETIEARAVVIAGGVSFKKAEFDGEENVTYGDSKELAKQGFGKPVVVAGGSNGAAQAALLAAKDSTHVTLISRKPIDISMSDYQVHAVRNHPKIVVLEGEEITRYKNGVLSTKSGRDIEAKAVGVFFGGRPDSSWLPSELRQSEKGHIVTNHELETTLPGVFAVGDLRQGSLGRIGAAVGDGQLAVKSTFGYFERLKKGSKLKAAAEGGQKLKTEGGQKLKTEGGQKLKKPAFDRKVWDATIDEAFILDKENPYLGQTIEEDEPKTLGGAGSGNFGHSGRPGEVGGSGEGGSTQKHTAESVTEKLNLDKARVDGAQRKIIDEAITENEVKYSRELAVATVVAEESLKDGDSKGKYQLPDGTYTPERAQLHADIARQIFAEHERKHGQPLPRDLAEPVVTFMAGMPGAGKSTAAKDLEGSPTAISIDPDLMKKYLPEYNAGLGSNFLARESGDVADKLMEYAARKRMNIVVDGTMKTSGTGAQPTMGDGALGKMAAFKEAGYRVETRFVDVDVKESITNTTKRFHEQFAAEGSGRFVPIKFSRDLADAKYGTKPRLSFEMVKNTNYKGKPLVDAYTHMRGWTGDPKTANVLMDSRGTLTPGGGRGK